MDLLLPPLHPPPSPKPTGGLLVDPLVRVRIQSGMCGPLVCSEPKRVKVSLRVENKQ